MQLNRSAGNPILSPVSEHPWESLSTTNPGAWYDPERREVSLLYRAAGHDPEHRIRFGLATSSDGYTFSRASAEPVFTPSLDGFDAGCVEDARIVKLGDWFYVTYAARAFAPGQYWTRAGQVNRLPEAAPEFPWVIRENATATGLALTRDFRTWIRAGRMTNVLTDDRDVILFPERIQGSYWMLHRPLGWVGVAYDVDRPSIWIARSDDLLGWADSRVLVRPIADWEELKIGGNAPPIRTPHGWLVIYHGVAQDRHYRLGAMLLDLNDPTCVRHRLPHWILQPEAWYELEGLYAGVCFPCGAVVIEDTLFVYYGGADKYVGVATCALSELLDHLLGFPVE